VSGGEHDAIRVVSGVAGEQDSGFDAGFFGKERLGCGEGLLDITGIGDEVGDAHGRGDFFDVGQVVAFDQELKPRGARFYCDGMAVEVTEGTNWRVFPDHDALGIGLHGRGYGDERVAVGYGFERSVRRAHPELGGTHGDLLVRDRVLAAGLDGHIQAFVFVIAIYEGGVEPAVFRLRVPVGLQGDFSQTGSGSGSAVAAREHEREKDGQGQKGDDLFRSMIQVFAPTCAA
jgi:hypothetical protein